MIFDTKHQSKGLLDAPETKSMTQCRSFQGRLTKDLQLYLLWVSRRNERAWRCALNSCEESWCHCADTLWSWLSPQTDVCDVFLCDMQQRRHTRVKRIKTLRRTFLKKSINQCCTSSFSDHLVTIRYLWVIYQTGTSGEKEQLQRKQSWLSHPIGKPKKYERKQTQRQSREHRGKKNYSWEPQLDPGWFINELSSAYSII